MSKIKKGNKVMNKKRDKNMDKEMNKKGNFVTDNVLSFILSVVGVVFIILLLVMILSPSFDKQKETSKNYLESLENAFSNADKNGASELRYFIMPESDYKYFLVYFGNKNLIENWIYLKYYSVIQGQITNPQSIRTDFFLNKQAKNTLCICYGDFGNDGAKYSSEENLEYYGDSIYQEVKTVCRDCVNIDYEAEISIKERLAVDSYPGGSAEAHILSDGNHEVLNKDNYVIYMNNNNYVVIRKVNDATGKTKYFIEEKSVG